MTWARIDDGFHSHPKVYSVSLEAIGLWTLCLSYAANYYGEDGFLDTEWVQATARRARRRGRHLIDELVRSGLIDEIEGGYMIHDFLDYNPSKERLRNQRGRDARKQALYRDRELTTAVRLRDDDHCRYCDRPVKWHDRRGRGGGTYDHVDPDGENTLDNIVVACRGCNSAKSCRTPEAATMPLLAARGAQVDLPLESGSELDTGKSESAPRALGWVGEPATTSNGDRPESPARPHAADLGERINGTVGEVLAILARAPRFQFDPTVAALGVESAIAAHLDKDPIAAAHTAVVWVSDPAFRKTSATGVFLDALRKQEPAAERATVVAGQHPGREKRPCARCRTGEVKPGYGAFCEQCSEAVAS